MDDHVHITWEDTDRFYRLPDINRLSKEDSDWLNSYFARIIHCNKCGYHLMAHLEFDLMIGNIVNVPRLVS